MSTHRAIDAICIAIIIFTIALTALFVNGEALGIEVITSEENDSSMFTKNDLKSDWNTDNATVITLNGDSAKVKGNGAYANGTNVYIVYAGSYILSGTLTNGSITVDADSDDKIWLMMNGVNISNDTTAALRVENADKVFITLADSSDNTIKCGSEFSDDTIDGAVYSRDDLTVNGSGSLSVTAEYKHGIVCNDDLVITGGNIKVTSEKDGIHANDSVRICNATLNINAGDDGITASNDDDTSFVYVESGNITIPKCYEGLEAITVTVCGGNIDITPSDDGINANGDGTSSLIKIDGGNIKITNPTGRDADGFDSNGSIEFNGGETFISVNGTGTNSAIDYGSENGGKCVVNGGTLIACGSSAMLEGISSESTQGFITNTSLTGTSNSKITLKNSASKEILSENIPLGFTALTVSTPDVKVGEKYVLTVDDKSKEITVDNLTENNSGFGGLDGGTPPERPDGEGNINGGTPPEKPDGEGNFDGGTPPEKPNGEGNFDGGTPPEKPDGDEKGESRKEKLETSTQIEKGGNKDMKTTADKHEEASLITAIQWEWLGISVLVLAIGIFIAAKFKC